MKKLTYNELVNLYSNCDINPEVSKHDLLKIAHEGFYITSLSRVWAHPYTFDMVDCSINNGLYNAIHHIIVVETIDGKNYFQVDIKDVRQLLDEHGDLEERDRLSDIYELEFDTADDLESTDPYPVTMDSHFRAQLHKVCLKVKPKSRRITVS